VAKLFNGGQKLYDSGVMRSGVRGLTDEELRNGSYYFGGPSARKNRVAVPNPLAAPGFDRAQRNRETFAELYSLTHAPDTEKNAGPVWFYGS